MRLSRGELVTEGSCRTVRNHVRLLYSRSETLPARQEWPYKKPAAAVSISPCLSRWLRRTADEIRSSLTIAELPVEYTCTTYTNLEGDSKRSWGSKRVFCMERKLGAGVSFAEVHARLNPCDHQDPSTGDLRTSARGPSPSPRLAPAFISTLLCHHMFPK